jgi:chromosome segregation ATPase
MEKLYKQKHEIAMKFKSFTEEILEMSLKTDFIKVDSMIEQRQQYIDEINHINEEIKNINNVVVKDPDEIADLKKEIREIFIEIAEIDKLIRTNINNELKSVKKILNQPETLINSLNIKA